VYRTGLGLAVLAQGDPIRAGTVLEECLALQRRFGNKPFIADALAALGVLNRYAGDGARARRLLEESAALVEALGSGDLATPRYHLGLVACADGDDGAAAQLLRDSLRRRMAAGDSLGAAECLEGLASVARVRRAWDDAVRLLAAAEAARTAIGAPRWPVDQTRYEEDVAALRQALGDEPFAALQAELGTLDVYRMTEAQAEAVVNLRLGQLAALERDEIFKEYNGLREQIRGYEAILASDTKVLDIVRGDLVELRDKYGDDRRTEITDAGVKVDLEDLIAEETQAVTISHQGYIKRLPLTTYRRQHRGGKGVSGGSTREDDFIEHFFVASTHAYLLCFTNRGRLYWLKVYDIPLMSRTSPGRSIANVLSLKPEEKISSVIPVREFSSEADLLMATKAGLVKKTALESYSRPKSGGIIGIALEENDDLISVVLTQAGDEVVLSTRMGMAIRFAETDARAMGRNTRGVKGINLQDGDSVVGMVVADREGFLLTVCENGYG